MATNRQNDDVVIGRNLAKLRQKAGQTQEDLAKKMRSLYGFKWSKATVWSIEAGERPLKLTEAKDAVTCLGLDWVATLPILLQGDGKPTSELEIKGKVLFEQYDSVTDEIPALADTYFSYLVAASEAFKDSDDPEGKQKAEDVLQECCPESLSSMYWDCIKDSLRSYCSKNADMAEALSGANHSDVYNDVWARLFNTWGEEWRKYVFPDDYYSEDDDDGIDNAL